MTDGPTGNIEQVEPPQAINKQVGQSSENNPATVPTQESLNILKPQPQKIIHVPDTLADVDTQTFLSDKTLQDSIRIITNKDDSQLTTQELDELKIALGENIDIKKRFISLLNFIQENKTNDFSLDFNGLSKMATHSILALTIAKPDFLEFYKNLKEKIGYTLDSEDLLDKNGIGSGLVGLFYNHDSRLFEEPTIEVIKAIHTNSNFDLFFASGYANLANNPNALRTIELLKNLGVDLQQYMVEEYNSALEEVADSPDLMNRLSFPISTDIYTDLKTLPHWNPNISDIVYVLGNNLTKEQLITFKEMSVKYLKQDPDSWPPLKDSYLKATLFIKQNEDLVSRLKSYGWEFNHVWDIDKLAPITEVSDKEAVFHTLDVLKTTLSHDFNLELTNWYIKLSQIPGFEDKISEALKVIPKETLNSPEGLKYFVTFGADASLLSHSFSLREDEYFTKVRDAGNRLGKLLDWVEEGQALDAAVSKIFSLSQKATELDKLGLKLMINSSIADATSKKDWFAPLLETSSVEEADQFLTKFMTEAALPVIYPNLQKDEFTAKQNQVIELASKDGKFGEILEICCRSVGIYGQEFPEKGEEFITLMDGIRQSIELNLERDPKLYAQKRAEFSEHQFDKIFENVPAEQREKTIDMWLDLDPQRRLRVTGEILTNEEDTLSRLKRIKNVVGEDLSVHLRDLFKAKVKEVDPEQFEIYKQYLFNPEGEIRQDFPQIYHSIRDYVSSTQQSLRNPQTPKEEKAKLGKSLGSYQAVADCLKALYRLGTISEERYKARINYVSEIDKNINEFSSALKKLRLLDPDRRSTNANTRGLEEQLLIDFGEIKQTMTEENVTAQTLFETKSTVDFKDLATAPDMTQSCQRLTEVTGHNQGAYSRLLDASNEMIDVYELKNGEKNRLARSFVELSNIKIDNETNSKLAILIDRTYVNPQYQNFSAQFSTEMISHMLDRINDFPKLSLLFNSTRLYNSAVPDEIKRLIEQRGYRIRQVSGEYLINQSNVRHSKYYDSFSGLEDVKEPRYANFNDFSLIEKI